MSRLPSTAMLLLIALTPALTRATTITEIIDPNSVPTSLVSARGIHVDAAGNVYLVGAGSHNVFRLDPNGGITELIDAQGGNFLVPFAVVSDASGNIYVSASGGNKRGVYKVDPNDVVIPLVGDKVDTPDGEKDLITATGLALDGLGNLYVTAATTNNVFQIPLNDPNAEIVELMNSSGDGIGHKLVNPKGIVADASGNVWVTGESTNNVFKIASNGTVSLVLDPNNGMPLDPNGVTVGFAAPQGVTVDDSGNVYVAVRGSHNAFRIAPNGVATEIINSTGDGMGNTLNFPFGIALDSSGNVFVSGAFSHNAFQIDPNGAITQIIDSTGDGAGSPFTNPDAFSITTDSVGNVYVAGLTSANAFKINFACGNGVLDTGEACDPAAGGACCTTTCEFKPASTECRAAAGDCDVAEVCTGAGAECPADEFVTGGTECRGAPGDCDMAEACSGTSAECPSDGFVSAGTQCRSAAGDCDLPETCSGADPDCPPDVLESAGITCRAAPGACDTAEECTGASSACPSDQFVAGGVECRASAGACDIADTCTGGSGLCPADDFLSAGTKCRASAGVCDPAELCSGSGASCPGDAKSSGECRAADGDCDIADFCDGMGDTCPADVLVSAGTECRAAAGDCDVAESCSGGSAACPFDAFEDDGTSCVDSDVCTRDDACQSGACVGTLSECGDGVLDDACGEECDDGNVNDGDGCAGTCMIEPGLDHFECYKARTAPGTPRFQRLRVVLEDEFGTAKVRVAEPESFCNPVDKNSEGINDATAHLTCYTITRVGFHPNRRVLVEDQFGELTLDLKEPKTLCVPSEQDGVEAQASIDHFQCYKARTGRRTPKFQSQVVTLEDEFAAFAATVNQPELFCKPVKKNAEEILDPTAHLTCYSLKGAPKFPKRDVLAEDQFGVLSLRIKGPKRLCVPSTQLELQ